MQVILYIFGERLKRGAVDMYRPLLHDEEGSAGVGRQSLEDGAGLYSRWTYSYLNPLFKLGLEKDLDIEDLGPPSERDRCSKLYDMFAVYWEKELGKPEPEISLWNALWRTATYASLFYAIFLFAVYAAMNFVPVLILSTLVSYFEGNTDLSEMELWALVCAMFVVPMVASLMQSQSNAVIIRMATQIRNALINAIFRKALLLSSDSRQQQSTGKIINMFANDTKQIQFFMYVVNNMVVAPFQIAIILYLIYLEVGTAAFAGLGYMILTAPFNGIMLNLINKTRKEKMKDTDFRVKLMNEVLNGIRVIKFYAWEAAFQEKIESIRRVEAKHIRKIAYVSAVGFTLLFFSTPIILPIIIFYTYIMMGNSLTASSAFTTIALFNMLLMPFAFLPYGIVQFLMSRVSVKRISDFLRSNELQGYINASSDGMNPILADGKDSSLAIKIVNANLRWQLEERPEDVPCGDGDKAKPRQSQTELESMKGLTTEDDSVASDSKLSGYSDATEVLQRVPRNKALKTLIDVNVDIRMGSLIAVVGAVGTGKTSFLNAILGEMYLEEGGNIFVNGSIAYCDQRPWILNATVEENILFGSAKDSKRFDLAVSASCLTDDLKIMPAGVLTEIGERGINLSGGQKARVSLARAVYLDADIYVLDDPLAAVDAHVGMHIFEDCIKGALMGKTRVLVTHQVHLLAECDSIIIFEDGRVKAQGSYKELSMSGIDIAAFVPVAHDASSVDATKTSEITSAVKTEADSSERDRLLSKESAMSVASVAFDRVLSVDEAHQISDLNSKDSPNRRPDTEKGKDLITIEELATGNVDIGIYSAYIKAGGVGFAAILVFLMTCVQAFSLGSNFYLTYWSSKSSDREDSGNKISNKTNLEYMMIFTALSVGGIICLLLRGFVLAQVQLNASLKLHTGLLNSILAAPVSFFDVTPLGRVVNRFSSDMNVVDEVISGSISQATNSLFGVMGALVAIAMATNGILAVLLIPLSFMYYDIQKTFRKTNTTIARLESITRSPIYADFSEILGGLTTIRAFREQNVFMKKIEAAVDKNTAPLILQSQAGFWLGIRLDAMGSVITFFVAFLAVGCDTFLSQYLGDNFISAGYLALGLTYSFSLTASLKFCIRVAAQLEAQMNSVERIKHYSENIDQDEDTIGVTATLPVGWPTQGRVEGRNVEMRYRDGPLVLRGLNFVVEQGQKIGVAGRTGSGKSSLMNALFRMEKLNSGSILIDGVDTKNVPLRILRSRLGIIPQDPVMFSASVRFNLDPFSTHTDAELWDILDRVDMKNHVMSLPNLLQEEVAEGGDNFSAGQRQLICIGRALLRKPKILVLDEATAQIDNQTDILIQKVVRVIFKQSTVLTIAHRLNTIIDSDSIMVLDAGKLGEMGTPSELLCKSNGLFKSLWQRHQESHHDDKP